MKNIQENLVTGALFSLAFYGGCIWAYTLNRNEMEERNFRLSVSAEARREQYEMLADSYKFPTYGALAGAGMCLFSSIAISGVSSIQERRKRKYINDMFR